MKHKFFITISLCVSIFACVLLQAASGQDTVVFKRNGKSTRRTGTIVDWQGNKISMQTGSRTRTIDATHVIEIQSQWPPTLLAARESVKSHNYEHAVKQYKQTNASENRSWVQAIVSAELIQIYDATENPALAAVEFLKLYNSDPQTRFFDLIPLTWSTGPLKLPSSQQSQQWIGSSNPVEKLVGASFLLSTNSSDAVVDELERLAENADRRIAQLATAQLWRTRKSLATPVDLDRWQRQLKNILPELRAGPLVVLSDVQKRLGELEKAQINFLKIPIVHSRNKSLSAYALFQCGKIMEDNGARDKAESIWRELINVHPSSQYAELARGNFKD